MRFEEMNIIEPIQKALKQKGYHTPTDIQTKAIPLVLDRQDVLGCAQTGTGKTAAFAIPIIQLIHQIEKNQTNRPLLRSLIVTPTRELAIQINDNLAAYSKFTKVKHAVIFGGVKQGKQVATLKNGVHILVATPGRLLDLISQGIITLNDIKMFVLDEADRMLDMGFINDIKKLLKLLPEKRQSLFFSATMPDNIVSLANNILKNPQKVEVAAVSSTAETITQYLYYTNRDTKRSLLFHILKDEKLDQVLIFSRTKHGADRISRNLAKDNIKAGAIHGNKAQNQRQKALKDFKEGRIRVLVATDIAARGIDIDKLKYVINFDIPNISETYVHRIGRSGRAGEDGIAISICEPEENGFIRKIESLIGKKIEVIEDNPFPQTDKPMTYEEKKAWEKEKERKKQEYFANRKSSRSGGGSNKRASGGNRRSSGGGGNRSTENRDKRASEGDKEQGNRNAKPRNEKPSRSFKNKKNEGKGSEKEDQKSNKSQHKSKSNFRKKSKPMPSSLKNKFMWPIEK